jgi:hypothetical protein
MQLHKTNPNSGYDIKASEASERAKTPWKVTHLQTDSSLGNYQANEFGLFANIATV